MPVVLGIDPGFSSLGVAVIQFKNDEYRTLHLDVAKTSKATRKRRSSMRVSADDVARARVLWNSIERATELFEQIGAVVYEVYQPRPGRGANGTKVMFSCGMAMAVGFRLGVPVYPVVPQDVKECACGKRAGSKLEVEDGLCKMIPNLRQQLDTFPKTHREHAADAAGVALVGHSMLRGF